MLRLSELPKLLRRTIVVIYIAWVVVITGFTAYLVLRSLGFDSANDPTTETIVLLAGLLIAPLLPFAQKLLFPGGGGVDFNVARTREASRAAEVGIEQAALVNRLPPLDFDLEEERK